MFDLFELRLLAKNAQRSFHIESNISRNLESSGLIQLMCQLLLPATNAINIIYTLDKMHELRRQYPSGNCKYNFVK